jgi:hypothetical protein
MTKEEAFKLVQGNIPILVRNPKTGKITNPFSTRYGYDAVINGLAESIVKKLNIAPVVKRYIISYTTRKEKGIKVIEIDADSEMNALGKFCLEVPLGLWVQIRSEDE